MYFKTNFRIPIIDRSIGFKFYSGKGLSINFLVVKTPSAKTLGITSYCKDGKHVLFFDYDGNKLNEIIYQLKKLQEYYLLSDIYLFENDVENSFHAVCLDKIPLYSAIEIIRQTTADYGFKYAPLKYALRRWVLRCEKKGKREKPKYLFNLESNSKGHEKSNAHRLFLEMNYGVKIKKIGFDDEKEIDCFEYFTASRIR